MQNANQLKINKITLKKINYEINYFEFGTARSFERRW